MKTNHSSIMQGAKKVIALALSVAMLPVGVPRAYAEPQPNATSAGQQFKEQEKGQIYGRQYQLERSNMQYDAKNNLVGFTEKAQAKMKDGTVRSYEFTHLPSGLEFVQSSNVIERESVTARLFRELTRERSADALGENVTTQQALYDLAKEGAQTIAEGIKESLKQIVQQGEMRGKCRKIPRP